MSRYEITVNQGMPQLWEAQHPFAAPYGNRYRPTDPWNEVDYTFASWDEFVDELPDSGSAFEQVYRWDWTRDAPDAEVQTADILTIYFVLPREARLSRADITVTTDDEPAVREWLTRRAQTIADLWAPLAVSPRSSINDVTPEIAAHVLFQFGHVGLPASGWRATLLLAIAKADVHNRELLARGYPGYVFAFELAQGRPDGIVLLREIARPIHG
uniref:hypothetical protein n=1 Tax=Herbidospora sakaeratensis TaxID=564415 RepID=UPI00078624A5|nr:hypothetical protein [Herbidospora sakaeratensis]